MKEHSPSQKHCSTAPRQSTAQRKPRVAGCRAWQPLGPTSVISFFVTIKANMPQLLQLLTFSEMLSKLISSPRSFSF